MRFWRPCPRSSRAESRARLRRDECPSLPHLQSHLAEARGEGGTDVSVLQLTLQAGRSRQLVGRSLRGRRANAPGAGRHAEHGRVSRARRLQQAGQLVSTLLAACRREPVAHTPIWLMRQAGRYQPEYRALRAKYGFIEMCKNSEVAAQVTLLPVTQLGVDAAILFADILLILE